jgi:glycosyltransferase involved in cell wall biosynthesis
MNEEAKPKISIIVPAYNEGDVIFPFLQKLQQVVQENNINAEILVINDGSSDNTANEVLSTGALLIEHPYNIGYGAAIKTGYRQAQGTVFITIDADGQHNPTDIPRLLELIDRYDMVVGNRTQDSETDLHRNIANAIYNRLATYVAGQKILDLTSGFRAIRANIARQFLYLLPNTFSSSATITLSMIRAGHSLTYIPIRVTRRANKSKSKIRLLEDGTRFLMIILRIAIFFAPLKIFVPLSLITFLLGLGYGLFRIFVLRANYGSTSALLLSTSVLVFLVGLVSEQIAQLRLDRSESFSSIRNDPDP